MSKKLTYTKNEEVKISKWKNYYIIPIIGIIIMLAFFIYLGFYLVSIRPKNKFSDYLESCGYTCNKGICRMEKDDVIYEYSCKDLVFTVDTREFRATISDEIPTLEIHENGFICNYMIDDYERFKEVDGGFRYDYKCDQYQNELNKYIRMYKEDVNLSGIDVNKFS